MTDRRDPLEFGIHASSSGVDGNPGPIGRKPSSFSPIGPKCPHCHKLLVEDIHGGVTIMGDPDGFDDVYIEEEILSCPDCDYTEAR